MNNKELLGLKIKELRKLNGLTQEQLAEKLNLDIGYISKLEVGRNYPALGTLEQIANVLNVDMHEFFTYTTVEQKDFKNELNSIYDNLSKENQYTLYRVAKGML